jgi:hypothetical protein
VQAPVPLLHVAPTAVRQAGGVLQVTGLDPVQVPAWQASVCVQASPSVHADPSAFAGFEQIPVEGLHVPAVWHWSSGTQVTPAHRSATPAHTPPVHTSPEVFALPSLHGVPFAFGVPAEQRPVAGVHVPGSLHWSPFVQVTGVPTAQAPA